MIVCFEGLITGAKGAVVAETPEEKQLKQQELNVVASKTELPLAQVNYIVR